MRILLLCIPIGSLLIGTLAYQVFPEKVPSYFPLNDPHAEYRIGKIGKHHAIFYRKGRTRIGVLIGRSKVDTNRYLGRRVRLQGNFRERPANTQCIRERCHQMPAAVVVDIKHVSSWEE
jgi:hypothetical protein